MNQYQWAQGYIYRCDAQTAGEMCEELERDGALTAESLLAANVAEDAPLHNAFEWDNGKAAHLFRVSQARSIICNLRVVRPERQEPQKKFYSIVRDDPHYESVEVIMSREESRERLLRNSRRDFETFRAKYETLSEWAETIAIGKMV